MNSKVKPGSWVNEPTTRDQLDIEEYLLKHVKDRTILHIGIGNSSLFDRLHQKNNVIGITIHEDERDLALEKGAIAFLCDKYSDKFSELIKKLHFDIVIDNNPSSYASGRAGFSSYISSLKDSFTRGNQFITHLSGMFYAVHDGFPINLEDISKDFGSEYKIYTDKNVVIITKI